MVLIYKRLQTIIAMTTRNKVIKLFCMVDDFCNFLIQLCYNIRFNLS